MFRSLAAVVITGIMGTCVGCPGIEVSGPYDSGISVQWPDAEVSAGGNGTGGANTGGANTGGSATGGMASGGQGTGGANTGGASSGGANTGGATSGGAPGPGGSSVSIVWRDSIQTTAVGGFDELLVERPIDNVINGSDAQGASLVRVANPLGTGFAMKHLATFDATGSRSELGIWSFQNAAFNSQAKRPEGVWVAQEWYFPEVVKAGVSGGWINTWDWHSLDANGGNRWHTSPGLMLAEDGTMRARWEWGGSAESLNRVSSFTSMQFPVGRWFDVEMHYTWATSGVALELWIDGALALAQSGAVTKRSSHSVIEMYSKWYGASDGQAWSPAPAVRYTRNVRIAGARIWPSK